MYYLVANWKSHKHVADVRHWFETVELALAETDEVAVVVCPPAVHLFDAYDLVQQQSLPVTLGMQDISAYPFGKYTGAIAAEMVAEQVDYAIVGHSERRRYFGETDSEVAKKVDMCLMHEIIPIVCVDEPYLESQLHVIDSQAYDSMIVAYEPLAAIGSGEPDTPEHAQQVARSIRDLTTSKVPVLYGGSVDAENVGLYLNQSLIDGALVGGASLDARDWSALVQAVV